MSLETSPQPTTTPKTTQTPFDRFKAAAAQILTTPKTALKKSPKKLKK